MLRIIVCVWLQPNHALIKLLEKPSRSDNRKKSSRHVDVFEEVKQLLSEKKVDGNFRNKDGYTALQLAVQNGHYECLPLLIKDAKANVNQQGP
jgi:ankyrin repeat protein